VRSRTRRPSQKRRSARRQKLDTALTQLENAQLVRRLAEEELAYLFKHALTHETAYESLLHKKRREIH
jgi:predicted ATPase